MRGEETVERKRGALAGSPKGKIAMQPGVVRIAERRDGREAVDAAAQNHDDQTRVARASRACRRAKEAGAAHDARAECARGVDKGAAGDGELWSVADHDHLRWNSGDMNKSASACSRNSARAIAWVVSRNSVSPKAVFRAARGSQVARMR